MTGATVKNSSGKFFQVTVNTARIIVGLLFIFSGLVKANDPNGLAYKMQEFYDVWKQAGILKSFLTFLDDYALAFSILMNTLEIVLGVALLLGWWKRFTAWMLLLLMIFFTFLTGYAVLSGKIRTCGCFGDCLPLTAMQSFIKDIILCVLVLIIVAGVKFIHPLLRSAANTLIVFLAVLLVLFFQWNVLEHNPVADCLPFKKGNNILELRKMPADAVPDKVEFRFTYEKNGEKKEFDMNHLPDSSWTYVDRKDIIVEKGRNNEPLIKDFNIITPLGVDTTDALLSRSGEYFLLFIKDPATTVEMQSRLKSVIASARARGYTLYVIATRSTEVKQMLRIAGADVPVYGIDAVAQKTASRTDPSLYLMQGPVVKNKWGRADLLKAFK